MKNSVQFSLDLKKAFHTLNRGIVNHNPPSCYLSDINLFLVSLNLIFRTVDDDYVTFIYTV